MNVYDHGRESLRLDGRFDDLGMGWDGTGWSSGSHVWMGEGRDFCNYMLWVGVMEKLKILGVGFQPN